MQNTWLRYKGENEGKYPEHLFAEVWKKKEGKIKYREEWLKGFNSIISEYGYREKTRERERDESEDECKALSN